MRAVIPTIITQVLSGQEQIRLGSVHPTRDFNYVGDVVRGFEAVLNSGRSIGEVINIGSNYEISVGDTVQRVAQILGRKVEVVSEDKRLRPDKSEVERLWADNAKARKLLGWTPEYAGLDGFERGLRETIAWFREPANREAYRDPSAYVI